MSTMFNQDPAVQKEFRQLRVVLTLVFVSVALLWTLFIIWAAWRLNESTLDHLDAIIVHKTVCAELRLHHPDFNCPQLRGEK